MKIEHRGIRITDLPGGIEIETSGERIRFEDFIWTGEQATDIRDALSLVIQSLANVGHTNPTGPWMSLDDIPEAVRVIRDKDGERRVRRSDGSWTESAQYYDRYAPFTIAD